MKYSLTKARELAPDVDARRHGGVGTRLIAVLAIAGLVLAVLASASSMSVHAQEGTPAATPVALPPDVAGLEGEIRADGDEDAAELVRRVGDAFTTQVPGVSVSTDTRGVDEAFIAFCAGEIQVVHTDREIRQTELDECVETGREFYRFEAGQDALVFVVSGLNPFLTCVSVDFMRLAFQANSPFGSYADVNPNFPDDTIALFGAEPGTDLFARFAETVFPDEGASPALGDITTGQADDLFADIAADPGALGFVPLSAVAATDADVRALDITSTDSLADCVAPSAESLNDRTYTLGVETFALYVGADELGRDRVLQEFLRFFMDQAPAGGTVGVAPISAAVAEENLIKLEAVIAGELAPDSLGVSP